jgi:tetratricopeptide (TPR) repeat protein
VRKQLLGFAIALAILIIVISSWVVWKSFAEKINLEAPVTKNSETSIVIPETIEAKNLAEAITAGEDFLATGELEKAAAAFAATAARYPAEIEPLILLAETQINLEEFEKARANLKAAEQLDAVNPDIFILRGRILLQEEKFAEAEVGFGKAGEHGKFWQGVMAAFFDRRDEAKKLFAETDDDRSFEFLKAFLEWESFPDSPKTHLDTLLTKSFVQIGEYELALAKIGPVLEDDADYRDAWLLTGYAQFAQKNFELAKQSWETAFALDSRGGEILFASAGE